MFLLTKLAQLELPGFVDKWIFSFLTGTGQQCIINGVLSAFIKIRLSIVQGSGIGPTQSQPIVFTPLWFLCS